MMPSLWEDRPPPTGLIDQRGLDAKFAAWMLTEEAVEVVRLIRRANDQIRSRGFPHYSIHALSEVVRWHYHKEHGPDAAGFKVNSIYLSRLARWLMDRYPDEFPAKCVDHTPTRPYFETRVLRS